jgi:hypothetical protein
MNSHLKLLIGRSTRTLIGGILAPLLLDVEPLLSVRLTFPSHRHGVVNIFADSDASQAFEQGVQNTASHLGHSNP